MANHYLLEEYKAYKGIDSTDVDNDNTFSTLLYASEKYLNNSGIYLQETEELTNKFSVENGLVTLPFSTFSFVSATINGTSLVIDDVFIVHNVIKGVTIPFTNGTNNFEMVYKLGFTDIPYNLKLAMFILIDSMLINTDKESVHKFTTAVGESETIERGIPKEFDMLINQYKVTIF